VSRYRKGLLHPAFSSQFVNDPTDLFNFTMTNVMDSFYNGVFTAHSAEGTFSAVCLSGIDSDNNTGTGTHPLDGFLDLVGDFNIIVRPILAVGSIIPDPRGAITKEEIEARIKMHANTFLAKASYTYDGSSPVSFGQILSCRFEKGSLLNSNFSNLVFDEPATVVFDPSYRKLNLTLPDISAKSQWPTQNPTLLGQIAQFSDIDTVVQPTSAENQIVLDWQIPGAHLPIATNLPHRITSIMGARPNPVNPGKIQASHSGIDMAQATGSPLYACFDGKVVALGKSSRKSANPQYIDDEFGIYSKVGAAGYGLKIVTAHTAKNNAGEDVNFTLEYGHIYSYTSGLKIGSEVKKGDIIATVGNRGGSTGPHLHLTMRKGTQAHTGGKLDPLAMFGWHNRINWKTKELKTKWLQTNPDLAGAT